MADLFAIDGRVYTLPIFSYRISTEILDGDATGRTAADGWPMFRQPQGTIINIDSLEFGLCDDSREDFIALIQALRSFGSQDFRTVKFRTQIDDIEQLMYGTSFSQDMRRFRRDGVTYWGNLTTKFIAKRGML